jgi:hypothetical protein
MYRFEIPAGGKRIEGHSYDCKLPLQRQRQVPIPDMTRFQRAAWTHVWSASPTNAIGHDLMAGIFRRVEPRRSIFGSHQGISK